MPTSLALTWSDQPFDGTVAAVAADRGTLVAVSFNPEDRVAWSSKDGRSWAEDFVPDPAPSDCEFFYETRCFPNTAGMGQLVRLGDTLYSFGRTEGFNDYVRPVGWRLTDGQSWQAIQSQSEFYSYGVVIDAAAGNDALVAATSNYAQYSMDVSRWMTDTSWMATNLIGLGDSLLDVYDMAWSGGTFVAVGAVPEPVDDEGTPGLAHRPGDVDIDRWAQLGRNCAARRLDEPLLRHGHEIWFRRHRPDRNRPGGMDRGDAGRLATG